MTIAIMVYSQLPVTTNLLFSHDCEWLGKGGTIAKSVIQQIQTAESIIKAVIGNQLPMEESSKPPKTETNFANNGTIIEKQDML